MQFGQIIAMWTKKMQFEQIPAAPVAAVLDSQRPPAASARSGPSSLELTNPHKKVEVDLGA